MSSMLSTGVSGLLALQTALDTTSHNISNASTPGFSRQTTNFATTTPELQGGNWVGTGVTVNSIQRIYSDVVASQVRTASSGKNQWDTYTSMAGQVNNLFSNSTTGISASLQDLTNAFQSVANSPSTSSERQVALSKAQALVSQLQSYGASLDQLNTQVNSQLNSEASTITGLAKSIANLNSQIAASTGSGNNAPNDLLDQRDALVDQLATHVNVNVVKQDNGQMNVFIGTGQSLVLGTTSATIAAQPDAYDVSRTSLVMKGDTGQTDITNALTGGTVGGLLDFRSEILDPAKNSLGQIAVGVSNSLNQQQNAGMDLNGSLGANLFTVGGVSVLDNKNNGGTSTVNVTRSNIGALTTSDYLLTKTAGGWSLQRTDTGQAVTMTGSGTVAAPFVADGLSIVVGGAASTGDKFMIKPTSAAVASMQVNISDPNGIAAAAPIIASVSSNNTGNATITQGAVVNAGNANLLNPVTIQFLSATTYTTDGGATTNTYTSGQNIAVNGWQVAISGAPATGDTFTVKANTSGKGDNRNALLMANAFDTGLLVGGTKSINDAVGTWVADIGTKSNQAQANLTTQSAVYGDAVNSQQSISGVNLDEEAANLVRYQQAYAAAAKVIAASNTLFNALIQAVG